MVSKEEFQGWILDYACYHRIFPIINAISLRHANRLDSLPVPHLRLACTTIHFIIENEQLSRFDEALKLVQQVAQAIPPSLVCQKTYMRLLTGIKIKALFQQLQEDTDRALVKLNAYFPRSTLKSTNTNQGETMSKFNQNHKNFRVFFFSLVSNENQMRAYLKEDYNDEFGPKFMSSIKKLCNRFLQQIESHLLPPMIEKVLACTECEKFSQISPATEMLLDYVHEKKLSSQSDPTTTSQQQPTQRKGQRAPLVFTEQELFEMLTVSHPLYTQDWLARDHSLNLSSEDLFDSFDSQENIPQPCSQMNSPRMIISTNPESTSTPSVISIGPQDSPMQQQLPIQQGTLENPSQESIRQPLQQQQHEARHSSPTSLEESPEAQRIRRLRLEPAKQPSALTPEENQLQTPMIREEPKTSQMETEPVQRCERTEEEMEHIEVRPDAEHWSQMLQDRVQFSKGGSEIGHESGITLDEVRCSGGEAIVKDQVQSPKWVSVTGHHSELNLKEGRPSRRSRRTEPQSQMIQDETPSSTRGFKVGHQSQIVRGERFLETGNDSEKKIQDPVRPSSKGSRTESQMIQDAVPLSERESETGHHSRILQDEIQLSEMELEEIRLSRLAKHDEIPSEPFEMVRENALPRQTVISERTLYQLSQDEPLQIGLLQHALHPIQQEEPCPQTLLQLSDIVHPSDPSNPLNVSSPLAQKTDPHHITSTPISHQEGQQENDKDNQRKIPLLPTDTDPSPKGSFIQPWPGFEPRQPSYKLLTSNVFKRNCNIDDRNYRNAKMGVAAKKTDPSVETAIPGKSADLSTVTLEENLPKHSTAAEETPTTSQPQSDKGSESLLSSLATSSSLRLSTDLSSISSGSCDIVSPSDCDSAELFFMGSPEEMLDTNYNFISRHLLKDVKACIIKLHRKQQLDVADGEQIYSIYS